MNHNYKGKIKMFSHWLSALVVTILTFSNVDAYNFHTTLTTPQFDTVPLNQRTTTDSIPVVDSFAFRTSSQALDAPVIYHADDSMVLNIPAKKMYLYGKTSEVKYLDNELSAPSIEYDQKTSLVKAYLLKDSLGKVISYAKFKQAGFESQSDTMVFNMRNQRGITKGTYTQQGEMFVYGERIKKESEDVFYALNGRFTTCNLDTPHFAFVSHKVKFINQKMAFTGPVHPEFEGVPVPVWLPFGIYPLRQGRHSGLIAPSFTANEQTGLALEGLGYYKVLSENWDIVARGTIHSYGGWMASVNPRYYKRYKFQGNFSVNLQSFVTNFKGDPDYVKTQTVLFQWSHNADTKARPGVSFTASVNAGSSKFNETVPNSPVRNFTNQMNSSITYAKVWKDKPYNLSVSANHNQNTQQRLINLNLPDVAFNVNTQYPFRRQNPVGDLKWFENIGIALNTNARSLSSFYDTAGHISTQLAENMQWGASHSVPITLSLPQIGPVQLSPSVSYRENWYQRKTIKSWNSLEDKVDTLITEGFYTARDMNFGISATTRIFGMYTFGKKSRVSALRHEIRPQVSVNYKPDMNSQNFYTTYIDTAGNVGRFSVFENTIYGPFGEGEFGGLSFGIDNVLSMKVKNKKDTSAAGLKKVSLIDGFSINGAYNFLKDSMKLEDFTLALRSNLFEKINLTGSARFSPYQVNALGQPINKFVWSDRLALARLTDANISIQSSFRGGDGKSKSNLNRTEVEGSGLYLDEYQQEAAYVSDNPGEFADFSIPWSLDFSYSLRFRNEYKTDYSGFTTLINQDVNWNSSLNLSPKWKVGIAGSYNITDGDIGLITMYLSREMHCWQMNINISPVGKYKFFSINISPKSGMLRDLKINRTRSFYEL